MKKLSKLQLARLLPFALMFLLSLLLIYLSPIWPDYELWKSGVIILLFLSFIGLFLLYTDWYERLNAHKTNQASGEMRNRFAKLKQNRQQ